MITINYILDCMDEVETEEFNTISEMIDWFIDFEKILEWWDEPKIGKQVLVW